jgi:hypothetical protein
VPLGVSGPFMFGGPFICHFIIRKWQSEVSGHLAASGERGQLREPSDGTLSGNFAP